VVRPGSLLVLALFTASQFILSFSLLSSLVSVSLFCQDNFLRDGYNISSMHVDSRKKDGEWWGGGMIMTMMMMINKK